MIRHERRRSMRLLARLLEPKVTVYAHCDLPCGVYDPAQARIEAESVKAICQKYADNADPEFRTRCIDIKEERSELVKHHLWVLWTDYFKPPHFEKYPQLHQGSVDVGKADELLGKIEEISKIFWETKQG
jgi:nickel superoxide dismutase